MNIPVVRSTLRRTSRAPVLPQPKQDLSLTKIVKSVLSALFLLVTLIPLEKANVPSWKISPLPKRPLQDSDFEDSQLSLNVSALLSSESAPVVTLPNPILQTVAIINTLSLQTLHPSEFLMGDLHPVLLQPSLNVSILSPSQFTQDAPNLVGAQLPLNVSALLSNESTSVIAFSNAVSQVAARADTQVWKILPLPEFLLQASGFVPLQPSLNISASLPSNSTPVSVSSNARPEVAARADAQVWKILPLPEFSLQAPGFVPLQPSLNISASLPSNSTPVSVSSNALLQTAARADNQVWKILPPPRFSMKAPGPMPLQRSLNVSALPLSDAKFKRSLFDELPRMAAIANALSWKVSPLPKCPMQNPDLNVSALPPSESTPKAVFSDESPRMAAIANDQIHPPLNDSTLLPVDSTPKTSFLDAFFRTTLAVGTVGMVLWIFRAFMTHKGPGQKELSFNNAFIPPVTYTPELISRILPQYTKCPKVRRELFAKELQVPYAVLESWNDAAIALDAAKTTAKKAKVAREAKRLS